MNKKILQWPNPNLRKVSDPVNLEDPDDKIRCKKIIKDLKDTLNVRNGLGIAAPQVGYLKRVFILNLSGYDINPFGKDDDFNVFINPVLKLSGEKVKWKEACLSVSWDGEIVERFSDCEIEYYDEEYNKNSIKLSWPISGILQHEFDHLDGILYVGRISRLKRSIIRKKILKKRKAQHRLSKRLNWEKNNPTGRRKRKGNV